MSLLFSQVLCRQDRCVHMNKVSFLVMMLVLLAVSGFGGCYKKADKGLRSPCIIDVSKI